MTGRPTARGPFRPRRAALVSAALAILIGAAASACSPLLGWGVLLWSVEDPAIISGSVLPIHIKSNIGGVWVVSVTDAKTGKTKKIELPLWQVEFVGSRGKAKDRAKEFREYAVLYAETLQNGLPIRVEPDNSARQAYRLRQGEIIKILAKAEGNPAMSGNTPLPGEWYQVMSGDGAVGYCFSYRLRLFEQTVASLASAASTIQVGAAVVDDPDLDLVLSRIWYPESYKTMIDDRRFDLSRYSDRYGFYPGQDSGILTIVLPDLEFSQPYTVIEKVREKTWRFSGANIEVSLRSASVILVQYASDSGAQRNLVFVALNRDAKDLALEERERRAALMKTLYSSGPVFRSENYGLLAFTPEGGFSWTGYQLLVPAIVSAAAKGAGTMELSLFLDANLQNQYAGAVSLRFEGIADKPVNFLYKIETNGLRLEYLPPSSLTGSLVVRRAGAPSIIFFSRLES